MFAPPSETMRDLKMIPALRGLFNETTLLGASTFTTPAPQRKRLTPMFGKEVPDEFLAKC
jgi:hypothetical protein